MALSTNLLDIDSQQEIGNICDWLHATVLGSQKKRGLVVGLSGGVDSSVVAALAVRALGKERVFGIFMPERHSSDQSLLLGQLLADTLDIDTTYRGIPLDGSAVAERRGVRLWPHRALPRPISRGSSG